jgi:DNA polymerase III delta subunit
LRPEFLEAFATDTDLSKIALRYHEIRPLNADALRVVIEKPAKVAGLSFEDDPVVQLVADTGSGDALPLLAFTLEQLADGVRRGGKLTHQRYDGIGGVHGALQRQADAALEDACTKAGVTRAPRPG